MPLLEGVSSTEIRHSLHEGDVRAAAHLLGRPPELDGIVVGGDQRGGTLGYPTANLAVEPGLLVPAYGIYAGAALGHRAAISIGTNPHYGGEERRIEPYLPTSRATSTAVASSSSSGSASATSRCSRASRV